MRIGNILKTFIFALPILEIAGFIIVGSWIGVLATLLLIILTSALGIFVLRVQGFVTLAQMQKKLQAGEHPAIEAMSGSLLMFAGFLLFLPGFITDIIGLLLLVPIIRIAILHRMLKSGVIKDAPKRPATRPAKRFDKGRTIEGEWHKDDEKEK